MIDDIVRLSMFRETSPIRAKNMDSADPVTRWPWGLVFELHQFEVSGNECEPRRVSRPERSPLSVAGS